MKRCGVKNSRVVVHFDLRFFAGILAISAFSFIPQMIISPQLAMAQEASSASSLVNSLKTLAQERVERDRFVIKTEGRLLFLKLAEIDWLEAASNYVRLHVGQASYLTRSTMSEVEQKLAGSRFIRIHRSIIVNTDRIKEVRPCNSGEFIVTLSDKKDLPASRGYRENLEPLLTRTVG